MDIEYVDYDPLAKLSVYDNTRVAEEAEKIARKTEERRKLRQYYNREIRRLPPPKPVKCPQDLSPLIIL
ncbi:hypothetical protein F442_23154 [Phytophthora nicotianae P10297]|uniref:Uncharacterized protein n=2 Tax=Phytophthora nicotianae TaxID=4792 RepID=W2XXJ1_PHYNI|nr:hypothetical protein F444_23224 [Phytophthora nicotianae P1976]ETP27565.1 hypothetical protein F442_23154 [Phytophthora nicotianae P10297]